MLDINAEQIISYLSEYGLKILVSLAIFIIGKWVAKIITHFLKKMIRKAKVEVTLVSFLGNVIYAILLVFVIIAALDHLGINTTTFAAAIAAAGLAIGLALQGSLSNLASGVLIIILHPFKIGDFIQSGSVSGKVKDIGILTTILTTGDNKTVIIPNTAIMSGTITNFSMEDTRRVDMVFGISYDDDMKKAKDIIAKVIAADKRVLAEPIPKIAISELADSSVNIIARPWVQKDDYWDVFFHLTEAVKNSFDKAGITIPYPKRDIHVLNETK